MFDKKSLSLLYLIFSIENVKIIILSTSLKDINSSIIVKKRKSTYPAMRQGTNNTIKSSNDKLMM